MYTVYRNNDNNNNNNNNDDVHKMHNGRVSLRASSERRPFHSSWNVNPWTTSMNSMTSSETFCQVVKTGLVKFHSESFRKCLRTIVIHSVKVIICFLKCHCFVEFWQFGWTIPWWRFSWDDVSILIPGCPKTPRTDPDLRGEEMWGVKHPQKRVTDVRWGLMAINDSNIRGVILED